MAIVEPEGAEKLAEHPKAAGIKKLVACLEALGMQVSSHRLGGGQIAVLGIRADIKMAIEARYIPGVTAKGGVSMKFDGARVLDPIGLPVNLEFDYTMSDKHIKDHGYLPDRAKRLGQRRNAEYNDGAQSVTHEALLSTATQMNEWLDDWLDTLRVDHKRQSQAKKAKPTDLDMMINEGATWAG